MFPQLQVAWAPTRAEALRRLDVFLPRAGRHYAEHRGHDLGPDDRSNVSALSPYLRHRLVLEEEVVGAVLDRHNAATAEKFLQEVCWRTYWKGWMELRPGVWDAYRGEVEGLIRSLDDDDTLRGRVEEATEGRTGIGCLDAWARELAEVGYLHNHARMWFATIWIFTLKLPWRWAPTSSYRHLLDGDPAVNTLSWRWVAGLQTPGKTYLARADNIAKYSAGRFRPVEPFAEFAEPVNAPPAPPAGRLAAADPTPHGPIGLLLTEDDLAPESLPLAGCEVRAVAGLLATGARSPLGVGGPVVAFAEGAMRDGLRRASDAFGVGPDVLGRDHPRAVVEWARRHGLFQVAAAEAPVGPGRELLDALDAAFDAAGMRRVIRVRRPWDDALWPMATAGYFQFKTRLPSRLAKLGL